MNDLIEIQSVKGYVDAEGTVWLNLEDVARGLGFVDRTKKGEYVKWERVHKYLRDLGFSTEVSKAQLEAFI